MKRNPLARENLADLGCEFEIEIADAAHAVRGKVHNHFIPDIAPFRMMVHGFGHQSHTRHAAESGDEVLALEGAVKFSILSCPAAEALQAACDFLFAQLFCAHRGIPPASPASSTLVPGGIICCSALSTLSGFRREPASAAGCKAGAESD